MKNTHTHTHISLLFFVVCGLWVRFYLHLQPPVFFCICLLCLYFLLSWGVLSLSRALRLFALLCLLCSLFSPDSRLSVSMGTSISALCLLSFLEPPIPSREGGSRIAARGFRFVFFLQFENSKFSFPFSAQTVSVHHIFIKLRAR